jgi:hypothetical protein
VRGGSAAVGDGDDGAGHGAASGLSSARVSDGRGRLVMGTTVWRAGLHGCGRRRWEQRRGGAEQKNEVNCATHRKREVACCHNFFLKCRLPRYIHRLTDEYTITYIYRLTDKCIGHIFLGYLYLDRFRYQGIYLRYISRYQRIKKIEEYFLFFYSAKKFGIRCCPCMVCNSACLLTMIWCSKSGGAVPFL